jgi:hypothetical protein
MKYIVGQIIYCISVKWPHEAGINTEKFSKVDYDYIHVKSRNILYHPDNVFLTYKDAQIELAARKLKGMIP